MSGRESIEILFERAKGKLTFKDWETLFNDVCDSITGKKSSFGCLTSFEDDAGKFFSFEEATERANTSAISDASLATIKARAETILQIKVKLGKISPAEAQKERVKLGL